MKRITKERFAAELLARQAEYFRRVAQRTHGEYSMAMSEAAKQCVYTAEALCRNVTKSTQGGEP